MMTEVKENIPNPLVDELFAAGAHYGFARSRRHASMRPYIYGAKNSIDILDLAGTVALLEKAEAYAEELGKQGKKLLLVGNKKEAQVPVTAAATRIGAPYVANRWIGGALTNFSEITKRLKRLEEIESQKASGALTVYTKREQAVIGKEAEKLMHNFGGIRQLVRIPDALYIVDPRFEETALREAAAMKIPIIALAGSDCDIGSIAYPVVANDAAPSSIRFITDRIAAAYEKGAKEAAALPPLPSETEPAA